MMALWELSILSRLGMQKINWVFLLLFLSPLTYSFECSKNDNLPDLRSKLGPIRDQDSIGWCYAFTAADLLTDYLRKNPQQFTPKDFTIKENMVSPILGAAAMEDTKTSADISTKQEVDPAVGTYDDLLKLNHQIDANKNELIKACGSKGCLWGCIPTPEIEQCKDWSSNLNIKKIQQLNEISKGLEHQKQKYSNAYQRWGIGGNVSNILKFYTKNGFVFESHAPSDNFRGKKLDAYQYDIAKAYTDARSKEEALCSAFQFFEEICKNCNASFEQLKPILEKGFDYNSSMLYEFSNYEGIKSHLKDSSKPHIKEIANLAWSNEKQSYLEAARQTIDEALTRGSIAGIGYEVKDVISLKEGGHASSIVGKSCIDGQEHYILRNSWGMQACEDGKKEITLKKLEYLSNRVKYGKTTPEIKENFSNSLEYSSCMKKCNQIKDPNYMVLSFSEDPQIKLAKIECQQSCYENNKTKLSKVIETFSCEEGYYFIKSEKLLKNIHNVNTIE